MAANSAWQPTGLGESRERRGGSTRHEGLQAACKLIELTPTTHASRLLVSLDAMARTRNPFNATRHGLIFRTGASS
jgi:hypothetical protein